MISETRERFIRAIVAKVPVEQIVEIHFFQPIKQGGVESGVAVIAADDAVTAAGTAASEPQPFEAAHDAPAVHGAEIQHGTDEGADATTGAAHRDSHHAMAPTGADDAPAPEPATSELAEEEDVEAATEAVDGEEEPHDAGVAAAEPARGEASFVSDEIPTESALDDLVSGEDWDGEGEGEGDDVDADFVDAEGEEARPARFAVYTARYRLVLKGIDRGKWESAIVAEADAPLLTVETVVRGVQRRSGDVEDPTRMSAAEVRAEVARMEAAAKAKAGASRIPL